VWESKADGPFAILEDTWNKPLGCGTDMKLHIRDEARDTWRKQAKGITILAFFCCYYGSTLDMCAELLVDSCVVSLLVSQWISVFHLKGSVWHCTVMAFEAS
jgi:hypothetical protein